MATRKTLTDRTIQSLKPAATGTRYTLYDALVPGFGIRVTDKGKRTFVVYRRMAGEPRPVRLALGTYPPTALEDARKRARAALEDLTFGRHPKERERERLLEEARRRRDTFATVAEDFIKRHLSNLRSAKATESAIRRELLGQTSEDGKWVDNPKEPRWRERPVTEITRRDIVELLEKIIDDDRPHMARLILAHIRKLFNWAIGRATYGLEHSPCDRVSARDLGTTSELRQVVLSNEQTRLVWQATAWKIIDDNAESKSKTKQNTDELGYPFGPFIRMLLITGQRRNEVARMRWQEIDLEENLWVIPAERMKGKRPHVVPLPKLARDLLTALPRHTKGDYVFTTSDGERPISGFGKAKQRLDKAVAKLLANQHQPREKEKTLPAWRFHDLRRTVRTGLGALPVPYEVRELVVAHIPPALTRTYDLHDYREEKRRALDLWADRLCSIIEQKPSNVLPLRPASGIREESSSR